MQQQTVSVSPAPNVIVESIPGDLRVAGWDRAEIMVKTDGDALQISTEKDPTVISCDEDLILYVPHGAIVNPPLIDASRRIAVAYDSGNARIAAFRYGPGAFERLWEHAFGASNHFLLFPDTGEIVVNDFGGNTEHVVVLNIESGAELARVATGSPVQAALFQSPGWSRDVYTCTFTTLSRTFVAS